jgi:hypothetical protein
LLLNIDRVWAAVWEIFRWFLEGLIKQIFQTCTVNMNSNLFALPRPMLSGDVLPKTGGVSMLT